MWVSTSENCLSPSPPKSRTLTSPPPTYEEAIREIREGFSKRQSILLNSSEINILKRNISFVANEGDKYTAKLSQDKWVKDAGKACIEYYFVIY